MKVLFFTYFFPPSGGISCQRAMRFAKYLPKFGIDVTVVTTADPVPWRFLDFEQSKRVQHMQIEKISGGIKFYESKLSFNGILQGINSLHRGDPMYRWTDNVLTKLDEILKKYEPNGIVITVPPMSSLKIACKIYEKAPKLPVFIDIRDMLWIYSPYGSLFRKIANKIQRNAIEPIWNFAIEKAKGIIVPNEAFIPSIKNPNVVSIATPFDPDDFTEVVENKTARFTILHAGSFHRFKSPHELAKVLACLPDDILSETEFVFLGTSYPLSALSWLPNVKFLPFRPHSEVIRFQQNATVNLAFVSARGNAKNQVIPGKIYDYIGAGRLILALAPSGNPMRKIVEGLGIFAPIENPVLSAGEIAKLFRIWQDGKTFGVDLAKREKYSAPIIVNELARFLKNNG